MQQYVCVRVPRMDNVNIALFDYDRYNTLYFFILNSDEQIYLRYGGRDSVSPDTYLNLDSIELAMKKGLELHALYQKGELAKKPLPKPAYPREIPLLVERTFAKNQCVECHLIGDFQSVQREMDGKLDKLTDMFRSPDIKTLGIFLDVPMGLVVKETKGAVAASGMRSGDRIAALNGTTVWTFADLQWELDHVKRSANELTLRVMRDEAPVDLRVTLPPRWWYTDIRYKQLTIDPRVYFESTALTVDEKKTLGLKPEGFASRVKYVSSFAETLKSHQLKVGDIITAVNGAEQDEIANTADFYIRLRTKAGDSVTLTVLRSGEKMEMPLRTFRMSFRK